MYNQITFPDTDKNYQWQLNLKFSLGFLADFNEVDRAHEPVWIELENRAAFDENIGDLKLDHNGIKLKLCVNDIEIAAGKATEFDNIAYMFTMDDSKLYQPFRLTFEISGFQDRHMPLVREHVSARSAIRLSKCEFEHIDVLKIFRSNSIFSFDGTESSNTTIFSCNGTATFEIYTPIYRWLLDNKNCILR